MQATIKFSHDWTETLSGDLAQGGALSVDYDLTRLPEIRSTFRGAAMWDVIALVQFHPDGQILAASVTTPVLQSPAGGIVDRVPAIATFSVPGDADEVELWFLNIGYSHFGEPPKAWDSRFGQNYRFGVRRTSPPQSVAFRLNAQPTRNMVNAMELAVEKTRYRFAAAGSTTSDGSELRTRLKVESWVRNVTYTKNVWFDAHVFDAGDQVIHAQTVPLRYKQGGGDGDLFEFDGVFYDGSRGQPGSVSTLPDARRLQLRLYCQLNGQVFTDGILHDRQLPEDSVVP